LQKLHSQTLKGGHGVDYDTTTGVLRVEITQPGVCEVATTGYEYRQS
jgi:hypothetical protein